jgi:hypothetical protein
MKTKIYKYHFQDQEYQEIELPEEAEILCVQTQYGKPCIYALVDLDEKPILRKFRIYSTGVTMAENESRKYIGTFQLNGGFLVFHLFEVFNNDNHGS